MPTKEMGGFAFKQNPKKLKKVALSQESSIEEPTTESDVGDEESRQDSEDDDEKYRLPWPFHKKKVTKVYGVAIALVELLFVTVVFVLNHMHYLQIDNLNETNLPRKTYLILLFEMAIFGVALLLFIIGLCSNKSTPVRRHFIVEYLAVCALVLNVTISLSVLLGPFNNYEFYGRTDMTFIWTLTALSLLMTPLLLLFAQITHPLGVWLKDRQKYRLAEQLHRAIERHKKSLVAINGTILNNNQIADMENGTAAGNVSHRASIQKQLSDDTIISEEGSTVTDIEIDEREMEKYEKEARDEQKAERAKRAKSEKKQRKRKQAETNKHAANEAVHRAFSFALTTSSAQQMQLQGSAGEVMHVRHNIPSSINPNLAVLSIRSVDTK